MEVKCSDCGKALKITNKEQEFLAVFAEALCGDCYEQAMNTDCDKIVKPYEFGDE